MNCTCAVAASPRTAEMMASGVSGMVTAPAAGGAELAAAAAAGRRVHPGELGLQCGQLGLPVVPQRGQPGRVGRVRGDRRVQPQQVQPGGGDQTVDRVEGGGRQLDGGGGRLVGAEVTAGREQGGSAHGGGAGEERAPRDRRARCVCHPPIMTARPGCFVPRRTPRAVDPRRCGRTRRCSTSRQFADRLLHWSSAPSAAGDDQRPARRYGQLHTAGRWVGMAAQKEAAMGSGDERRLREVVTEVTAAGRLRPGGARGPVRRPAPGGRVVIDGDGGVTLDAAAEVSRAISERLDEAGDEDPAGSCRTPSRSPVPGIGRPLTLPRHFRRARTRLVALVTIGRAGGHRAPARPPTTTAVTLVVSARKGIVRGRDRATPTSSGPRSRSSSARRPPRCSPCWGSSRRLSRRRTSTTRSSIDPMTTTR